MAFGPSAKFMGKAFGRERSSGETASTSGGASFSGARTTAPKKKKSIFSKIGSALAKPAKMAHKATMGTAKAAHKATMGTAKKMTPGI